MPSSDTRILVSVGPNNALQGQTELALPGQDLFTNFVDNVHAVPGEISVESFKTALSKTLARYPHVAGRLVREGDNWKIKLTNDPIPVIITRLPATPNRSASYPFPNDWTIQTQEVIEPFLNSDDRPLAMLRGAGTEVLMCFKLTYWEEGTVIGMTWSHTIGDAKAIYDFTACLSTYYHNPNASDDQLPLAPSFHRHFFPKPYSRSAPAITENFMPRMPHLAEDFALADLWQKYGEATDISQHVQLRFSGATLKTILDSAKKRNEGIRLTVQDALSAYLVSVLNQCFEVPITTIINAVNYRSSPKQVATAAEFTHPAASCNEILMMYSERVQESDVHSVPAMAKIIRESINLARESNFIYKWMTLGSYLLTKAVNAGPEGRWLYFAPDHEAAEATINSNYRFDWNEAHFGFPDKARFFTWWSTINYFRVFCANPRPVDVSPPTGIKDANVSFRIVKARADQFASIVLHDYPDTIRE